MHGGLPPPPPPPPPLVSPDFAEAPAVPQLPDGLAVRIPADEMLAMVNPADDLVFPPDFDEAFFSELNHLVTADEAVTAPPIAVHSPLNPPSHDASENQFSGDVGDFSPKHAGQHSTFFTNTEHASIGTHMQAEPRVDARFNGGDQKRKQAADRRRTQNREASARFRARAKQREVELQKLANENQALRFQRSRLQTQVGQLEAERSTVARSAASEALAWIRHKFWLRLKIRLRTIASCVIGLEYVASTSPTSLSDLEGLEGFEDGGGVLAAAPALGPPAPPAGLPDTGSGSAAMSFL